MDLTQTKLSKTEWENIEIPVLQNERTILDLICRGIHNPNISINNNVSFLTLTKIEPTLENHTYVFATYFEKKIQELLDSNKDPKKNTNAMLSVQYFHPNAHKN